MRQIPLRGRDGLTRAYALVDDEDFETFGSLRWYLASHGYAARTEGQKTARRRYYLHREILGLQRRDALADHVNGDKLDNRRANLRVLTSAENGQNTTGRRATSAYRGVSWSAHAKSWRATAHIGRKQSHVGYFKNELDAAIAASLFRRSHMPYAVEDGRPQGRGDA